MTGHFINVDDDDCRLLLQEHRVGRVSWVSDLGIELLPVSYTMAAGQIVFRTDDGTSLASLVTPTEVIFEIDDVDQVTASGWSVVVRGLTAKYEGDLTELDLEPWAPGDRRVAVVIHPTSFSGRAVSAP